MRKVKILKSLLLIVPLIYLGCKQEEEIPIYKLNERNSGLKLVPGYYKNYEITTYNTAAKLGWYTRSISHSNIKNPLHPNKNLIAISNLSDRFRDGLTRSFHLYELSNDTIYYHGIGNENNEFKWVDRGNPRKVNDSYVINKKNSGSYTLDKIEPGSSIDNLQWVNVDSIDFSWEITGIEIVSSKIGKFECYKMVYSNSQNIAETRWIYPDIGTIVRISITSFYGVNIYELNETNIDFR